ncbi:MAG: Phenylacetic acid catabolic protein, partial [Gammaproteobacteria bacterium]
SHERVQNALNNLWPYTGELFESDEVDAQMCADGIGVGPELLKTGWDRTVDAVLGEATLKRPEDGWMHTGGKQGRHSEHLGLLLAEMQYLQRAYPGAEW